MLSRTLISTKMLASHLQDPAVVVIDCRFKLDDDRWGGHEYTSRHIPGAVYAHLNDDLSGPRTGTNGRHPLPDPLVLADTLGRLGVGDTGGTRVQVVAYDQDNGMFASRLWWLLRWLGHDAVAVLDGGFATWVAESQPTRSGVEKNLRREFRAVPRSDLVVDARQVSTMLESPDWHLLDARAPERYRGETEPIDKTPGHIPGAVNHFFQWNVNEQGTFRTPAELRDRLRQSFGDARADRIVCYCGSGVTACQNLLAMEHAEMPGAKLYPGSWSEWSADPARPVERG
jgi:thiosulfate/3-mercaptopyruvate sulfurtransferase